jgi:hypothetical protein
MHHPYNDITSRIPEKPKWYDEFAVPRYCEFSPNEVADIYANEVALVHIKCQACRADFFVAFSISMIQRIRGAQTLVEQIRDGSLHYGDPPNSGCCGSGATMNCHDERVLQYWHKGERSPFDWQRDPSLEISLDEHVRLASAGRGDNDATKETVLS